MAHDFLIANLTAPELALLQQPDRKIGTGLIKQALAELVARGALRVDQGTTPASFVRQPDADARMAGLPALQVALNAFVSLHGGPAVASVLLGDAESAFGRGAAGYIQHLAAGLEQRGLLQRVSRGFWIFRRAGLGLTDSGRAATQALRERMREASAQLPGMLRNNPAAAVAMAGALGSAMLLDASLRDQILGVRRVRAQSDSGVDSGLSGGSFFSDAGTGESLSASFDVLDVGSDASGDGGGGWGGDSGSDSGGGDSGGGDSGGGGGDGGGGSE